MSGSFITFEGGEGSGKSTQVTLLEQAFHDARIACVRTREPGGSPGAERIRELLVNGDTDRWDAVAETLLFYAARMDHVNNTIKPALQKNSVVICDRFADSTMVYQGVGKNVSESFISELHRLTLGDFAPDLTLILDINPAIGLQRARARAGGEERFENMDDDFHRSVREGFLAIAGKEPTRCTVVDASQDAKSVHAAIIALVNQRLGITLTPCRI